MKVRPVRNTSILDTPEPVPMSNHSEGALTVWGNRAYLC
jgi:hypothetical protein